MVGSLVPQKLLSVYGEGVLELLKKDFVSSLLVAAEELLDKHKLLLETPGQQCSCFHSESELALTI